MRAVLLPDGLLRVLGSQGQSPVQILDTASNIKHTVSRVMLHSFRLQGKGKLLESQEHLSNEHVSDMQVHSTEQHTQATCPMVCLARHTAEAAITEGKYFR